MCATRVVEQLKVRNGKVVAPGGVEYEMLVLPFADADALGSEGVMETGLSADTMSERMLRKIGELVDAGAHIVAPQRPVRAPVSRDFASARRNTPRLSIRYGRRA